MTKVLFWSCFLSIVLVGTQTTMAAKPVSTPVAKNVMRWHPVSSKRMAPSDEGVAASLERVVQPVLTEYEPAYEPNYQGPYEPNYEGPYLSTASCDGGCDSVCLPMRTPAFWIRAEYLLWSINGIDLPPLVTTSPTGTLPGNAGVLGEAGTTILYGGETVLDSLQSGARLTLGWNDDPCGNGFEASVLGIFEDDENYSDNRSLLARPVFDTDTGAESSMIIAHPDFLSGAVSVHVSHEFMAGEFNRRQLLSAVGDQRLDFLVGYRYGKLDESLSIDQASRYTVAQGPIVPGTTVSLFDKFTAENQFHGAQFGFQYQQRSQTTSLSAIAKLALGVNQAKVTIDGATVNTVPGGGSSSFVGGLLAQATNIGTYDESEFSMLPELGVTLATRLNRNAELSIGYSLLYFSEAVRVADAVNRNVSQFPPEATTGTADPAYKFQTNDCVVQGLNVGLRWWY